MAQSNEEIQELDKTLQRERNQITEQVIMLSWHLRSWSRNDVWAMSGIERKIALKYIEERMKVVEKTRLPLL